MNKQNKLFTIGAIALLIAVAVFGFASCDKDKDPPPFKTTFTLTAWDGKTITVVDERTDPEKQLDELGIIAKLQSAVNTIGTVGDDKENKQGFNSMLGKVKIVVKDPDGTFNEWKTNPSANELWVNFDLLNDPENDPANNTMIALVLIIGIGKELAKGNDASS